MELSSEQSPAVNEFNDWREALIDTLKCLWKNYLHAQTEDAGTKEHWIHLFLFHYQYVDEALAFKSADFQSFFNSIPEQICSFLLQHVYTVVCRIEPSGNCTDITDSSNCSPTHENHNFSQVILDTPGDCKKVVALRNFLTDELGHRLLDFLLKVDIKLIASQKGLCNLCINLFPNCAWKLQANTTLLPSSNLLEFIGDFRFHEFNKQSRNITNFKEQFHRTKTVPLTTTTTTTTTRQFDNNASISDDEVSPRLTFENMMESCNQFKVERKTSDEIAFMLIKLLIKCAANENETPLSEQSLSVVLLKFALSKLPQNIADDEINHDNNLSVFHTNFNILKCSLLQLIEQCLNNIFIDDLNIQAVDFRSILITLTESYGPIETENNETKSEQQRLGLGLSFIIFGILHNLIIVENRRLRQKQQQQHVRQKKLETYENSSAQFFGLSGDELMRVVEICEAHLRVQIKQQQQQQRQTNVDEETGIIFECIVNALAKIIENIEKIERQQTNLLVSCDSNGNTASSNAAIGPIIMRPSYRHRHRRRHHRHRDCFFNAQQMHCTAQLHQNQQFQLLPRCCFFQSLMLELQAVLPSELQQNILKYWLRVGICCCHYTLLRVRQFLNCIIQQTAIYQRYTYKLMQRKILHGIFVRENQQAQPLQASKQRHRSFFTITTTATTTTATIAAVNCVYCNDKLHSWEYHIGLLKEYQNLYTQLKETKPPLQQFESAAATTTTTTTTATTFSSLILFLSHLKDIALILPNGIAVGILAEIVLPIFREYKCQQQQQQQHADQQLSSNDIKSITTTTTTTSSSSRYIEESKGTETGTSSSYLRILSECLNIFVSYLNDIRLIKAYYNEENIQHLEDLINEPDLVAGICELIKIGIENIAFLGDNPREQANLSNRLITLQLKSSKRSSQQLNAVMERLQKYVSPLQFTMENGENLNLKRFCLKVNDTSNIWIQSIECENLPTPMDILKSTSLLWSLNNELLRISHTFYNEFANSYSIVRNDEDKFEDDENNQDPQRINNRSNIQDILALNYNALSSFLLIGLEKKSKSNSKSNSKSKSNVPYINKKMITETLSNQQYTTIDWLNLTDSYSSSFSPLSINNAITQHEIHWDDSRNYSHRNSSALHRILRPNMDESIILFDIRNCIRANQTFVIDDEGQINSNCCNEFYTNHHHHQILQEDQHQLTKLSSHTHEIGITTSAAIASVENSESVISKVFRMFGSLLRLSSLYLLADLNAQQQKETQQQQQKQTNDDFVDVDVDDDLKGFFNPQAGCKKLLLKIFEATMAICIKGYQNEAAEKMEKYLQKLKTIILSNAFSQWQQYADESTRENAVLQALQVLLQIAELSNTTIDASAATIGNSNDSNPAAIRMENNNCNNIYIDANDNDTALPKRSGQYSNENACNRLRRRLSIVGGNSFKTSSSSSGGAHRTPSLECVDASPNASTESDVDLSDNDRAANDFLIPDEGYEADGEIPEASDSETTAAETGMNLWSQLQPTSRYRNFVLHKGLCRLIVSIVIELTKKCTTNPNGWNDSLTLLSKRLFVIRDSLGGSQFLLQSFKPLFESNDPRLKELQQSIMELITDLDTPETLCTIFNVLTAKTPPVDVILRHMHSISFNSVRKAQPFIELVFPVVIDGNCVSTSDLTITERIQRIRNYHLHTQAVTPFTRAPCIIPILHARVLNSDGFTLSIWFQVKSMVLSHKGSSQASQTIDEDIRSSLTDDGMKTHIVSIGTSHVMLSIYISSSSTFSFELTKPNGIIQQCSSNLQSEDIHNLNTTLSDNKQSCTSATDNSSLLLGPGPMRTDQQDTTSSSFRNALKQTKQVLLNSFSNIIHGPNDGSGGIGFSNDSYFETGYLVNLKNFRLQPNKWTHLSLSVDIKADTIDLYVYIDGIEQKISIPCRHIRNLTRTHAFQLIALGDSIPTLRSTTNNSSSYNSSQSSIGCTPLRFGFSNLMLFNRRITAIECLYNLTAMGPDFIDLTTCQIIDRRPNFGFLNLTKMTKTHFGKFADCIRALKDMRSLLYTAQQPDQIICYDAACTPTDYNSIYHDGRTFGLILYGELTLHHLQSLQTATLLSGGLSTLLYLFARVVESNSSPLTQSLALDILLSVGLSDSHLYAEFIRNDYTSLIGYVIKTDRSSKDVHLLRSIVNNACAQPLLLHKKSGDMLYIVDENTTTVLVYPRLLISILRRYSDWHRSSIEHSNVLDLHFQCIIALTRENHPQRTFNMTQLSKAGLFPALLNLCKVYLIESPNPVFISKYAAQLYVDIIALFAVAPAATPSLMDEIMKLLLLLHKPSECYITHDRSKFYFLLSFQSPPSKEKTLGAAVGLYRVASPFRKRDTRPGIAIPVCPNTNQIVGSNNNNSNNISETLDSSKRRLRINRLRKINELNMPSYKRAIRELEENLENVANCSKLNKNALRLISPVQASKWSTLLKRHLHFHFRWTPKHGSKRLLETSIISHRRTRSHSIGSLKTISSRIKQHERSNGRIRDSLSPSGSQGGGCTMDDSVADLHFSGGAEVPISLHRRHKALLKTDFYRSQGIMALQEGLYKLLKDLLCLLPDNVVDEVLKHYIKVEILIVLSNHSSCAVRSAILHLFAALCKRLPTHELLNYTKSFYPQHLANQIAIHPTDAQMFKACFDWVFDVYGEIDAILDTSDFELRLQQRFGINTLFAIAAKLIARHVEFAEKAFRLLDKVFHCEQDQQFLIESGLLQCCVKALYSLYSKSNVILVNTKTENAILDLIINIGTHSLKSVGHMNVVWDILNMLSFYQENQQAFVIRAFRSVQSRVQLSWINMFFTVENGITNFKVIALGNASSPPTLSETKTRLGLLIDRACQFFTVFDASYTPSEQEIKLFEFLVSYCISNNQRCNNFIAWGLQPTRPVALRAFIVDTVWDSCKHDYQPTIVCDGKMIKSLLWLCLLEDLEQPIENLERLCKYLGIDDNDSAWNLEAELEKFEMNRCNMSAKQKSLLEKTIYKFESLALGCIETSMVTTRRVAELQNAERKLLMNHMKDYDETTTYTKWLEIIRRMTHEGSAWHCKERYEKSWELDDTEGPSRVHTRLRRCHNDIDKRFMMPDYENASTHSDDNSESNNLTRSSSSLRSHHSDYVRPLDYLISSYDQQLNISLNSQILYNFPAKYLPVDGEIDGEIIITDHKLYFLATYRCKYFYVTCDISNISEIWIKRYQHQEKAFEIFLDTNKSLFFSLQNLDDWKIMRDIFCDKIVVSQPDQSKISLITQQWREGLFTNWEYIMTLNQISGRTYNDLMQYPVFPWILSNYTSEVLDLTDSQNFRKLEKPIAVQHETNEQHYINHYMYMNSIMTNMGSLVLKPYHYSSHYSNSGTVLHFLVRVPPFTSYFLRYQDNNFDLPDRTFHALSTTWKLASCDSPTDVKELIPEFFCLPEMFENFERFNFGCRQNGERVDNVLLPPWCYRDSRLFVLIHRQALECEVVRRGLHQWIDLIFGFKQTGESAVEAINVFHPATYSTFMESQAFDPIERRAFETMVKTYGQMPRQLFKSAHPASKPLNYCLVTTPVMQSVRGLRWGVYLGSPQLPTPTLGNIHKLPGAEYLVCFSNTNVIYGLPMKSCVMQGIETDTYNVISWGHDDRIVRIQSLNKPQAKLKYLLYNGAFDEITVCGTDPNSNQLWFGHRSGRITVYKCLNAEQNQRGTKGRQNYVRGLRLSYNSAFRKMTTSGDASHMTNTGITDIISNSNNNIMSSPLSSSTTILNGELHQHQRTDIGDSPDLNWIGPAILIRHTDEITSICLSIEFKIAVSAGRDGLAVVWDLNDWSYVRTIQRPSEIRHSPITLVTISPTLGDIVTVHTIPRADNQFGNSTNIGNKTTTPTPPPMERDVRTASVSNPPADECFEVTEESLDDFVNVSINPNGRAMVRLHTINARYIQHLLQEEQILAVCYSYIKEGVGVNVIATAIEGGIIRLWSSWNLKFVCEIITGISNIKSITYSTHQHLVVLTKEAHIQVWETEGLYGSPPKFPQISYK